MAQRGTWTQKSITPFLKSPNRSIVSWFFSLELLPDPTKCPYLAISAGSGRHSRGDKWAGNSSLCWSFYASRGKNWIIMKLAFYLAILAGTYLRPSTLPIRLWANVKRGEATWMCDWHTGASRNTVSRLGSPHLDSTQRLAQSLPSVKLLDRLWDIPALGSPQQWVFLWVIVNDGPHYPLEKVRSQEQRILFDLWSLLFPITLGCREW